MESLTALGAGAGVAALGSVLAGSNLGENAVKGVAVAAFGANVIAVSIPGRLDGEVAKGMQDSKVGDKLSEASRALLPAVGKSYITPAGWAFAIWGPIYLGEIFFTAMVALSQLQGAASESIKETLPFWVSANLFQSLWCATFRPRFHTVSARRALGPFVSSLYLGLTALSLGKVSITVSDTSSAFTLLEKAAFVPITMHFGWTTAATLVNVNGALANYKVTNKSLYTLACGSVAAAVAASGLVAAKTKSATYSFVIGWALFAVSGGMKTRIESSSKEDANPNAESIRSISYYGGSASVLAGLLTVAASFFSLAK